MSHDCINCPEKNKCAIELIAPWLDEHEEEIKKAKEDCVDEMTTAMAVLCEAFPPALIAQETMASFAKQAFLLGYHKGRQFPQVPQVYQQ